MGRSGKAERAASVGAKDYILVEDIDDTETLTALASLTCEALRASERPKRRKYGCI